MFPRVSDAQDVCTGFPASAGLGDTITAGRVWCSGGHTAPSPGWHRPGGCRAVHPAAFVQDVIELESYSRCTPYVYM